MSIGETFPCCSPAEDMSVANTEHELLDASEPVHIPEKFPDLLFQFSKAAIRTQPVDILAWSAE